MVIDANIYWFLEDIFESEEESEKFMSEVPKTYGTSAHFHHQSEHNLISIEKPTGYHNLDYVQGEYRIEQQLADMDQAGIDKAVLKIPGCHEWMSLDTCKKFNDGMYEYAQKSEGRLIPLAVLPPFASKQCFKELKRCREELGMNGIQLCAHYGEKYLDDEIFADFFKKLNEEETIVYIHHTPVPVQYDSIYEYNNLRRSYGRCVDQTTAIGRELFSGFFEKYPNLKFVHSMLGGGFFAIANMLLPKKTTSNDEVKRFENSNDSLEYQFKNNVYFEMSHAQPWGKEQLECAVSVLGADHIIYGSSYPVRKEWMINGAQFVRDLDIREDEKNLILYKNAQRLYHIK